MSTRCDHVLSGPVTEFLQRYRKPGHQGRIPRESEADSPLEQVLQVQLNLGKLLVQRQKSGGGLGDLFQGCGGCLGVGTDLDELDVLDILEIVIQLLRRV